MPDPDRRAVVAGMIAATGVGAGCATAAPARAMRGFNLIETGSAPFGSDKAAVSLRQIREAGANAVALIPFLWQAGADRPGIILGDALPTDRLAAGIAQARAAGLAAIVKPHVWVPGGWAGQVAMKDEAAWTRWFAAYRAAVVPLARLAAQKGAAEFVLGTELRETVRRSEWKGVIAAVRAVFPRRLVYVAHGADEVERVPFWPLVDAVGASMYPPLGGAGDEAGWRRAMAAEAGRVRAVAQARGKPMWVGEIGIRSAADATAKPWESAEERVAPADPALQGRVIAAWLDVLTPMDPGALLVWRWFTDPGVGGTGDTDFTVQGKPAADAIGRVWQGRS